jgi:hypothetical protein
MLGCALDNEGMFPVPTYRILRSRIVAGLSLIAEASAQEVGE